MKTKSNSPPGWRLRHRCQPPGTVSTLLLALILPALAAASIAKAAAPALNPRLIARPLTPGDITKYALPSGSETSGGISNVGVGTPVYLEVDINSAIAASNVVSVAWSVPIRPAGSAAYITNSPLGTNIPVYEPADQLIYQSISRQVIRPDIAGSPIAAEQYTVSATVNVAGYAATNVTYTFTAGSYVGINTCSLCHSGGVVAADKVQDWQNTAHATIFTQGINGQLGFYAQSCLPCHTVGYDTNTASAPDNGFAQVAKNLGWVFPTVLTNTNWANLQQHYPSLANLANIQCENCHGPGSQHAYSLGNTNLIAVTTENSGDCNQCHDAPTHHIYGTQWYASAHAVTTTIPTGSAARAVCVGCHTSDGFIGRLDNFGFTNTAYSSIDCQTCHEAHGETTPTNNPHLIRTLTAVTMGDGSVITNAGEGALCLECHHSRDGSATNNVAQYALGNATWIGGSSFGPHDGPQGDMIEGVNAITYGLALPSSPHAVAVTNACVGCHMQTLASSDPGLYLAGSHTFNMSYNSVTNGVTNEVDEVGACVQCHGNIKSFNFPVADLNGNVVGVQTQVQNLLNQLSTLLPNANNAIDGTVKTSLSVKTNWTTPQLNAAYNWQFVANDGSLGVHNAPFAIGLLQASIGNLTGISTPGGLPDAWEIQYFGSTTNALGAPNATPANDGIPNWLKYTLGLNPFTAGLTVPGGVLYADGGTVSGSTNTVQIYTAAEVAFNTVVGKTYQIQEATALSGGWQTISTNIIGNGAAYSYLTPTRNNVQQFFRVVHNP